MQFDYLKINFSELHVRLNIYQHVLENYLNFIRTRKKTETYYLWEKKVYKPYILHTFFFVAIPVIIFHTNIFLLYIMRKQQSIAKYFYIILYDYMTLFILFFFLDKKVYFKYISQPNPYGKYMREEFLLNKDKVSERSYKIVEKIDREINNKYKF